MNVAALSGEYPPNQGEAAKDAADLVRAEMRRIAAVMTAQLRLLGLCLIRTAPSHRAALCSGIVLQLSRRSVELGSGRDADRYGSGTRTLSSRLCTVQSETLFTQPL